MSDISSEYTKLAAYLENEKLHVKKSGVQSQNDTSTPSLRSDKSQYKFDNKKLKGFNDVNIEKTSRQFIKHVFEENLRKRILNSFKRQRSFERDYVYLTEIISCYRKIYFDFEKFTFDENKLISFPYSNLMAQAGQFIHELVYESYKFDHNEYYVKVKDLKLSGRIDSILGRTIFDIKTAKSVVNKAKKTDIIQISIGAYLLEKYYNFDKFENGCLIYVPRTLHTICPIDVDLDMGAVKERLDALPYLRECLISKIIPDPLFANEDSCKYCIYHHHCDLGTKCKDSTDSKSVFLL